MSKYEEKLTSMGIKLSTPPTPVANYVGFVKTGNLVYISGQIPLDNGELKYVGTVGAEVLEEDAKKAARICAINILSQLKLACDGDLDKMKKCIRLGIFVNAVPGFKNHPEVANGASDIIAEVFGDAGKHSRAATGARSLPRNVSVEIDGIFEIS